ncbi:BMH2 [Symbiodinium sp. KB8]|nr:BMH2 [Symbiodinium sp. KB8]
MGRKKLPPEEEAVVLANVAERAERYEDMVDYMKERVKAGKALAREEREMFAAAYKGLMASRRFAVRVAKSVQEQEADAEKEKNAALAAGYLSKVRLELQGICIQVLEILEGILLPKAETGEPKVFYLKLQADYYRYLAEFLDGEGQREALASAAESYVTATGEAEKHLMVTHPVRLGVALNHAVFKHTVMKDPAAAAQIVKESLELAARSLEGMPEEAVRDAQPLVAIMQDNLRMWLDEDRIGVKAGSAAMPMYQMHAGAPREAHRARAPQSQPSQPLRDSGEAPRLLGGAACRVSDGQQAACQPGPPQHPSMGSVFHSIGRCKPCSFFVQNRCFSGDLCEDCHYEHKTPKQQKKQDKKKDSRSADADPGAPPPGRSRVAQGVDPGMASASGIMPPLHPARTETACFGRGECLLRNCRRHVSDFGSATLPTPVVSGKAPFGELRCRLAACCLCGRLLLAPAESLAVVPSRRFGWTQKLPQRKFQPSAAWVRHSVEMESNEPRSQPIVRTREGAAEDVRTRIVAMVKEPQFQMLTISTGAGAITVGAAGGAFGIATGIVAGSVAGVAPALATFGLSIPAGAMLGAAAGLLVGTTAGGVAGGTGGFCLYKYRVQIKDGVVRVQLKARKSLSEGCETARKSLSDGCETVKGVTSRAKLAIDSARTKAHEKAGEAMTFATSSRAGFTSASTMLRDP